MGIQIQDDIIIIVRPADGHYQFEMGDTYKVTQAIFGNGSEGFGDTLEARVCDKLWTNIYRLGREGFTSQVAGWTRPYHDMLLDLIEGCRRAEVDRAYEMLVRVLGDDLAAEFFPVLAKAPITIHCPPGNMSDVDRKGFRRVGPMPEFKPLTSELFVPGRLVGWETEGGPTMSVTVEVNTQDFSGKGFQLMDQEVVISKVAKRGAR